MEPAAPASLILNATERRVLGVLIEKGLTTPEYYPLTIKALVAGCNQKNNRDPLTSCDDDQVEITLRALEQRGFVASVIAETGRVNRWRQELGRKCELNAVQLAVIGELLLRGAQSEGDLRGRASRMRPIETLESLRELLQQLRAKTPPLVVRLSPEGAARGVRWTHTLQSQSDVDRSKAEEATLETAAAAPRAEPPPARSDDLGARVAALAARIAALEARVAALEA